MTMPMTPLMLHQSCIAGPVTEIAAQITPTQSGCKAQFRLTGDMTAIKIPAHRAAVREDNLWKTTCFEIFWQPKGGAYYREFNLSPSSKWACYDFDGFRDGMRDAPVDAITLSCSHSDNELILKANIAAEIADPAKVALNAIVEDHAGNIQFWALSFAPGKPEFHSELCRQAIVER